MRPRVGIALAVGLLVGCTDLFTPVLPDWIANRQPLQTCGHETVEADGLPANVKGRRCLLVALRAGDGAELISTQTTEEGDPVTSYYRVHENGTIELFVDATRDRFGSRTWERYSCDSLVPVDAINPDLASRERVFLELDCVGLPIP